jgi:aromatic ring-opening dioxygenase LigB subunit
MTLVFACIAPHGSEAIEQLAPRAATRRFQKTRDGLGELGKDVGKARPDTIVIATPHNLRLWEKIGIILAENSTGTLQASSRNKKSVSLKAKCDVGFAKELLERSTRKHLPVIGANYGTSDGPTSDIPMDWGTLVPLWFMLPRCRRKPKVVIVTPSREIPLSKNFEFGRIIAEQAEAKRANRIVFVASADQAHAHKKAEPYGFSTQAKDYDKMVLDALAKNRISAMMQLKQDLVDAAKPDSLWQMAVLAGVADKVKLRAEIVSYQVPTYFGMICASFQRMA